MNVYTLASIIDFCEFTWCHKPSDFGYNIRLAFEIRQSEINRIKLPDDPDSLNRGSLDEVAVLLAYARRLGLQVDIPTKSATNEMCEPADVDRWNKEWETFVEEQMPCGPYEAYMTACRARAMEFYTTPLAEFRAKLDTARADRESCRGELCNTATALAAAQEFKTYVHTRLDQAGIPHGDPENPHQKEGCRIGARLDLVFAQIKNLQEVILQARHELTEAMRYDSDIVGNAYYTLSGAIEEFPSVSSAPSADKGSPAHE